MNRVVFIFAVALAQLGLGCRTLDYKQKTGCNTSADCASIIAQCVKNVCVDPFDTQSTAVVGTTGPSGPPRCLESTDCGAEKVCTDGACSKFVERDYEQTRSAFRQMLCKTLQDVCGETKMTAKYGADPLSNCYADVDAPWNLSVGPAGVSFSEFDAVSAARCVADTRNMLMYGLRTKSFAALPVACQGLGYAKNDLTCDVQSDCYETDVCTKPPSGTGKWPCAHDFRDFGETCFDRTAATLPNRIKDTCSNGLYCDMRVSGTCKRLVEPGQSCLTQYFTSSDNDPVFDPCKSGYRCSETSGTCEPFVAECPL